MIRSGALPGARNMALDEALCGGGAAPPPTLRLYRWQPWTLSLGWFQTVEPEDVEPFLAAGHDLTRRPTGGGAIFHARELTYSLVLPAGDRRLPIPTEASYEWVHSAVAAALREFGVDARPRGPAPPAAGPDPFFCFQRTAPVDLVAAGRKLVGSAQRRTATALLHHGSLPLAGDPTAPGATSIGELLPGTAPPVEAVEDALIRAFERLLGAAAEPADPSPAERDRADRAVVERFGNPDWVLRRPRGGRRTGPVPAVPVVPGGPEPLILLRAAVDDAGLHVLAEAGGSRQTLPHGRLHRVDPVRWPAAAAPLPRASTDPWESTFRRSHFPATADAAPAGPAPPSASPPRPGARLVYLEPPLIALVDAARFNFRDLGRARSGDPVADLGILVRSLLARAPGALPAPAFEGPPPPRGGGSGSECLEGTTGGG